MSDAPPLRTLRAGRYAIVGELGAGSQAETLDAVDKQLGRAVAIKRFQVRGAKSWKDVELAEREARVLATLSHPNLPVYIEHFEEDGALYLVMEKIEGETLASIRKRKGSLSSSDIARFFADTGAALGYLHGRAPPIIHRDIKPGNVIRRADGSFAIVDFGSVRDQLKPEGGSTVVGTFGYMAPEQFQGRALPCSDVYAVAATALTLLTGQEPEDLPHRGLALDVRAALGRSAEPRVVRALEGMLNPDPDQRARVVIQLESEPRREPQRPKNRPESRAEREPPSGREWQRPEPWDLYQTREQAREKRRLLRAESQRLRDELKYQIKGEARRIRFHAKALKRERRAQRRYQRQAHGFGPAAPLVLALLVLGLTFARVATFALFRVFLPTLLMLLSVFFRRAALGADRCREIGRLGDRSLVLAIDAVRGRAFGRPDPLETDGEAVDDDEASHAEDSSSDAPRAARSRLRVDTEEPGDFADEAQEEAEIQPPSRSDRRRQGAG